MTFKFDYDIKKSKFCQKIRIVVYVLMLLYMNWSITKNFPIETLVEMIDSSVRSPGEVESITFKGVLIRNFFVMDRFMYSGNSRLIFGTVHKSVPNKKVPN